MDRRARWLLLCALLLGAVWSVLLPPWMGEDEPWHLEYAHHLSAPELPFGTNRFHQRDQVRERPLAHWQIARRVPGASLEEIETYERDLMRQLEEDGFRARVDFATRGAAPRDFDELFNTSTAASQPPLYYSALGVWLWPWRNTSPSVELVVARLPSLALYLLVVLCTLLRARLCFDDESPALLAAAFAALWPMHARQAAVVNNDVLAKGMAALALLLAARLALGRARRGESVALLAVVGLGIAAKSTAVGVVPAALWALLSRGRTQGVRSARLARLLGLLLVVTGGLGLLWLQHSPVLPRSVQNLGERLERGSSLTNLRELWQTSFAAFDWYSRRLGAGTYLLALVALALPLAACCSAPWRLRSRATRTVLGLAVLTSATQFALVVLRGQAAGRYLLPALPALALLIAGGVCCATPRALRERSCLAAACALFALHLALLAGPFLTNQYLIWGD